MANQTTSHWRLPAVLDGVSRAVLAALKALERTLDRLHGRVEYPAPSLADRVACTVNTTINSTTLTDITGATVTFTPEITGKIKVSASCNVFVSSFGAATDGLSVALTVNGVANAVDARDGNFTAASQRSTIVQFWVVPVVARTQYTVKLQAGILAGTTSAYLITATRSGFVWELVPDPYRYPSQ